MFRLICIGVGLAMVLAGVDRIDDFRGLLAAASSLDLSHPQHVVNFFLNPVGAFLRSGVWIGLVGLAMVKRSLSGIGRSPDCAGRA